MNDEKEAVELMELTAKYRFLVLLREGKQKKGWWAWVLTASLNAKIDTIWREMLVRIPVEHNIAIDRLLESANISHYG